LRRNPVRVFKTILGLAVAALVIGALANAYHKDLDFQACQSEMIAAWPDDAGRAYDRCNVDPALWRAMVKADR
jgi:hypothetical protein